MDTKGIVVLLGLIVLIAAGIAFFAGTPGPMMPAPASNTTPAADKPAADAETPPSPIAP